MNPIVKYGLLGGLLVAALQVILHYVSFETSQNMGVSAFITLVIPIVLMVLGVKAERANQEGFISFGEALKTAFFVFMLCAIVSTIITFVHMKTWNDDTWEQVADIQRAGANEMMEMFGEVPVEVEEALDEQFELETIKANTSGVNALMLGILMAAFVGILISLIVAAIMKKNHTP